MRFTFKREPVFISVLFLVIGVVMVVQANSPNQRFGTGSVAGCYFMAGFAFLATLIGLTACFTSKE